MTHPATVSERLLRAPKQYPHFAAYWANKHTVCRLFCSARARGQDPVPRWKLHNYQLSSEEPAIRQRDLLGLRAVLWAWWLREWARLGADGDEAHAAWNGEGVI